MQLAWCSYQKKESSKPRLFVILETTGNAVVCLDGNSLTEGDISMIRQLSGLLEKVDLQGKIAIIKDRASDIMRAFRTLKKENLIIYRTWPIKPI